MFLQSSFDTGILMASVLARAVRQRFDDVYQTLSLTFEFDLFWWTRKMTKYCCFFFSLCIKLRGWGAGEEYI